MFLCKIKKKRLSMKPRTKRKKRKRSCKKPAERRRLPVHCLVRGSYPRLFTLREQFLRVRPIVNRYFLIASNDLDLKEGLLIPSSLFINDQGEPCASFVLYGKEGYCNLYVNGVLQEGDFYQIRPSELQLASTDQLILSGSPIIIESIGFMLELTSNPTYGPVRIPAHR